MTILHHIDFQVPALGEWASPPTARWGYANTLLAQSPAGYWRLGESAGPTAADLGGQGLHGTYFGSIAYAQGGPVELDASTAVGLNGSSTYIRTGLSASAIDSSFTFTCWFRSTDAGSIPANIIARRLFTIPRIANSSRFALGLDNNRLAAVWNTGASTPQVTGPTVIAPDRWYHAAVIYNANKAELFLNGKFEASKTGGLTSQTVDYLLLGIFWPDAVDPRYFNGSLAEAAFFDFPLTSAQIRQQYLIGTGQ